MATTLYRNGRVRAARQERAGALLVDGSSIAWIGPDDAVPSADTIVELAGALVTPAFVDAHVHATATGLALTGLDLRTAGTLTEALDAVERAARAARGRPLLGGGWDDTRWPEARPPTAAELDRASYGGVVYLARVDVHSAVASSALLAAVPGTVHENGWVRGPAHDPVRAAAHDALTAGQRRDAQRAFLRAAAAVGIGCVHENAGPVISSADDLLALLGTDDPGPDVIGYWAELGGVATARELGAAGAAGDLFCDGSLGSHTAALQTPYADRPDTAGLLRFDTAELAEHVAACTTAGLQAGFHAIGDAAVDQVLDAVELAAARVGPPRGAAHRIEHAEYVHDPARLAASGLVASVQPCFDALWGGRDGMYAQRLGETRAGELNRLATFAAAGVPLAFGSDSPVTELGPWAAIRAAVHPSAPGEALDADTAFDAHTRGGWRAAGRDGGVLAAGAPATFAVWDDAGTGVLPDLTPGAVLPTCRSTVVRGRTVYDSTQ